MALTKQEFMDLLELKPEWKKWMISSIQRGLEDYNNTQHYSKFVRTVHTVYPTARAINRNCQILHHARHALYDLHDIRECPQKNRPFFILGDQARVSFKMLDAKLRPKNYPTLHNDQFMEQRLPVPESVRQARIPEMTIPANLSNIVVGYKFQGRDDMELYYEIYVVCPNGKYNNWVWLIHSSASVIELFPSAPAEPATSKFASKNRVRARKVEKEQDTDEQSDSDGQSI